MSGGNFRTPNCRPENPIRTHIGDKPVYKCQLCHKSNIRASALNSRMLTHRGEAPYQCEICNKRFALHRILRRPRRTHATDKQQSRFNLQATKLFVVTPVWYENLSGVVSCPENI